MDVNLGCGDRYQPGWVNVDRPDCPHRIDEAVDLTRPLPWPPSTVDRAYLGHVLEHLTLPDCAVLLARLLPILVPGGRIMIVGPDVDVARAMAEAGTLDVTMDGLLHGGHRWPGDEHLWESRPTPILNQLATIGYAGITQLHISEVPAEWPVADRSPVWQFGIAAHRPTPGDAHATG